MLLTLIFLLLLGGTFSFTVGTLLLDLDFRLVVIYCWPSASRTTFLDSLHTAVHTPMENERFTRDQHTQSAETNHRVTRRGTKKTKNVSGSGSHSGLIRAGKIRFSLSSGLSEHHQASASLMHPWVSVVTMHCAGFAVGNVDLAVDLAAASVALAVDLSVDIASSTVCFNERRAASCVYVITEIWEMQQRHVKRNSYPHPLHKSKASEPGIQIRE